jgi:mono/diheme cytochrome c family protein
MTNPLATTLRTTLPLALLGLAAACAAACEGHRFSPPDRKERVGAAAAAMTPALFDTVRWASDSARAFAGGEVYARACRKCHGYVGEGDAEYARSQGIDAPSLVRPERSWAVAIDSARRRVFTGHEEGMPTFGVAGLTPREIDAVSHYVLHVLRRDGAP